MLIDNDIEAIIAHGESRTAELNSKYEGLNLDDLSNFKSENMIQTWEGEDFQNKVDSQTPNHLDAHRLTMFVYSVKLLA